MRKILSESASSQVLGNEITKDYDVGVLGWWYGKNYGSILTYYGLNRTIAKFGYKVLMIHEPLGYNGYRVEWPSDILSLEFAKRCGYNFTQQHHFSKMPELNNDVDTFIVGSDQLWNPGIGRVNDDLFLDFVTPENKRIAYSTSFGNNNPKKFKPDFIKKHKVNLSNFQAISVRETYAVDMAKTTFGVEATQVADPVFLLEEQDYAVLADKATHKPDGDYLVTFFLDLTPEKRRVAEAIADKLGLSKIVVVPNPDKGRALAEEIFDGERFEILKEDSPENFLNAYRNANYVITDSFHGTAFSIIFSRPFSAIYNNSRGVDRFINLLAPLGFGDTRRVYETDTPEKILSNSNVSIEIDFEESVKTLLSERKRSLIWLEKALAKEHKDFVPAKLENSIDDTNVSASSGKLEGRKETVRVPVFQANSNGISILAQSDSTKISVSPEAATKGNWMWCDLPFELKQKSRYRIEVNWTLKTSVGSVNLHIMNRDTNDFKVIGSVNPEGNSKLPRTDILEFAVSHEGYSQLMLGALHFKGKSAGVTIHEISIVEVTPGNAELVRSAENSTPSKTRTLLKQASASNKPVGSPGNKILSSAELIPLREALISSEFVFFRAGASGEAIRQNVRFMPDGSLQNVSHKNEAFWSLDGDRLSILSKDKQPTTVFMNLKPAYALNDMKLVGGFLPNPNVQHVLQSVTMSVEQTNKDVDFSRVKLLLAKLRDYGIKDVILSPGGRDVVLNRAIENNPELFNAYFLLDERSAGYFALGVANKTQRTTAVIVTSGTAASNLAPAMTEAFYMNLPLLAITADRYPEYHGIGEDQTIEQANMFEPMVRKSVDLRGGMGRMSDALVSRQISEAILSTQFGPAHINIPANHLPTQAPIRAAYKLPQVRHIERITPLDNDKAWKSYADELLNSKRIMLLYRQSYKPTGDQLDKIRKFAQRYNVVIVADWLSNINGSQVVHPFNALKSMTQSEFNKSLLPDIVISVGTKNVMNHPINFKLRGAPSFRHWDVEPHGELKDLYFKLTNVLHVDKDWFFDKFAELGEGRKNDQQYLNQWKAAEEASKPHVYQDYSNQFVVQQLLEKIPEKSLFHIGVGSSFMLTHTVNTVPNKELEVFLNMGTNGIDGSASAFMGQVAVDDTDRLKVLLIGDVSFFYDMNSLWNKKFTGNTRFLLVNNSGSSLLKHYGSKASYAPHSTVAKGWVESVGLTYMSAENKSEFVSNLQRFLSDEDAPLFFEVFL